MLFFRSGLFVVGPGKNNFLDDFLICFFFMEFHNKYLTFKCHTSEYRKLIFLQNRQEHILDQRVTKKEDH